MDKLKVLVADDEEVIRELLDKLLTVHGYSVTTAVDGLDVLDKIRDNDFNILILDLKMPAMDGMEVLHRIKEMEKELIIIIITGYATIATAKEAMKMGCFDYITKPFDAEHIEIIIKRAIEMQSLAMKKKKLQEQLQITEKLSALAQMGTGVAHEVNTVLTSIKLFLEMLQPKLSPIKEGRNIGLLLEEIERAENLIKEFLKFSKPDKTEFFATDINGVIKRGLELLKYRLKKQKIKVLNKSIRNMPKILCDPAKMEEVFLNVFSNSIDAMSEGGKLTIESSVDGNIATMTVSDTGSGVSPENIAKLCNPFFSTKPHGTGLGLSIAYRIIGDHNGTITITSKKNRGTTVKVDLPIHTQGVTDKKTRLPAGPLCRIGESGRDNRL